MPYINLPPVVSELFWGLEKRIGRLENAYRFNAPSVPFLPTPPSNSREGDIFFDTSSMTMKYWNGTDWVQFADNNLGTDILTDTSAVLNTVNNNLVATGNPVTIEYQKIGKMLTAFSEIKGTTVTNWGTGQIYFQLPSGFPIFAHDVVASGTILDNGTLYTIFGVISKGDNKMYLYSPTSNGGSDVVTYNKPAVLDSTSVIGINGVAILS